MNDLIELLFCPVHGALGWLLICWPCAFFALRRFFIFFVDLCNKVQKTPTNHNTER